MALSESKSVAQGDREVAANINWTPVLSLRPHRFYSQPIRNALSGVGEPLKDASRKTKKLFRLRKRRGDPDGNITDLIGITAKDVKKFQNYERSFLTLLNELPDDSVLHLDLKPDRLCNGCAIGAHCTATNYEALERPYWFLEDTKLNENYYLNEIRKLLIAHGYREDVDFKNLITSHTLYDFNKRRLYNPPKTRKEVSVEFNSLLVKVSALRTIIREADGRTPKQQ